jgi:hypothetical protein
MQSRKNLSMTLCQIHPLKIIYNLPRIQTLLMQPAAMRKLLLTVSPVLIRDQGGLTYPPQLLLAQPATLPRPLASVSKPRRFSIGTHGRSSDPTTEPSHRAVTPGTTTSSRTWADILSLPKPKETFRYIFQNIQGLPVNPCGHKHSQISTAIHETEADVFGMAELNLNFHLLGPSSQWTERFRHLRRNHSVHSYNQHDSSQSRLLFGGTAQIATGACSHRALSSGADASGLG